MSHRPPTCSVKAACAAALLLLTPSLRAERLFVGILETDSYQSALYGASAFSRIADLPLALELVQTSLAQSLAVPSLAGLSATEPLRIVQTLDPALPLGEGNPANVALIPLADSGQAARQALSAAYAAQSGAAPFTVFERPSDTNLPPRVALAVSGRHLLTSTSRDALQWAWDNRARLLEAPPQSLPGTFRVLVNPQRLADLLAARRSQASAFVNADALLRDCETLSFALTLDGQALAFTLRGKPKKASALEALVTSWRKPAAPLWNGIPDSAFFASLSAGGTPELWAPYLGKARTRLLHPSGDKAPADAFTGDRLTYLAPTRDGQGLCLVQVEPLTNAAPVRQAIQKLDAAGPDSDIVFTPRPLRTAAGTRIESYAVQLRAPQAAPGAPGAQPSIFHTLLGLFLKKAVLETAVTADGQLVTVIGPPGSFEQEQASLTFAAKRLTLDRAICLQDGALAGDLTQGASFRLAALLRHIVSLMPDVKPEQVRMLPSGGDGATFAISRAEDGTATASLRFQSNEIAALQRINRDGREVLQELLLQMLSKQMMDPAQTLETKPKAP